MTVNSPNHSATEGNPTAETDARIDELRRELAELFALRRRQHPLSARMSPANPTGDTVSPSVPPVSAPGRIARLWRTGRAVLRHLRRSPAALFADVERYFARSGHQPEQWTSTAGGRIAVADRLQDVWPLNVEVRDNLPPTLNVLLPSLRKTDLTG